MILRTLASLFALDLIALAVLYTIMPATPAEPVEPLVTETIIGWGPKNDELVALWTLEKRVSKSHCYTMSQFAGGGRAGAITVRCQP